MKGREPEILGIAFLAKRLVTPQSPLAINGMVVFPTLKSQNSIVSTERIGVNDI